MMLGIRRIISVFIAIVFISSTIMQFHHHDATGNMVMFSIDTDSHCLASSEHHCVGDLSHKCNNHNHNEEQNCSLKLSITKIVKTTTLQTLYAVILFDRLLNIHNEVEENIESDSEFPNTLLILPEAHNLSSGLRAPPII